MQTHAYIHTRVKKGSTYTGLLNKYIFTGWLVISAQCSYKFGNDSIEQHLRVYVLYVFGYGVDESDLCMIVYNIDLSEKRANTIIPAAFEKAKMN